MFRKRRDATFFGCRLPLLPLPPLPLLLPTTPLSMPAPPLPSLLYYHHHCLHQHPYYLYYLHRYHLSLTTPLPTSPPCITTYRPSVPSPVQHHHHDHLPHHLFLLQCFISTTSFLSISCTSTCSLKPSP